MPENTQNRALVEVKHFLGGDQLRVEPVPRRRFRGKLAFMHQCTHHAVTDRNYGKAFALGVSLNVIFVIIEVAFGFYGNSLALLADAGHNLSDVLGLVLAWTGYALGKIHPTQNRTYGLRSTTILAALFNALLLLLAVGGIAWEAIGRFTSDSEVAAPTVIVVALIGVVINTVTALLFMKGRHDDINLRGAFLHMAADALLSLGVAVAGAVILYTSWHWVDPLTSLLIAVFIFVATLELLRDSFELAVQSVPKHICIGDVEDYLAGLPGVEAVHDLHVWAISTTETALTVHLIKPNVESDDVMLKQIAHDLEHDFRINHSTIQIERDLNQTLCAQAEPGSL